MNKTEYINIQNNKPLDWNKVDILPDNAMLKVKPELWIEWDFEKNDELGFDIWKMTKGTAKEVYWMCENNHSKLNRVNRKVAGIKCPYCSNKELLKGFNDMWTTNPQLASLLSDSEDGYKYMQSSGKKVNWKCTNCNSTIKNRAIYSVLSKGISCPNCSDGISFGEKIVFNLLNYLKVNFLHDVKTPFSENYRYDFVLDNNIIEVHGVQHYKDSSLTRLSYSSLEDAQDIDNIKYNLAITNGIAHYIVIDARYSDFDWIKKSILHSELSVLYDLSSVDWDFINEQVKSSNVCISSEMYENGSSISEIAQFLKVDRNTIRIYLDRADEIGLIKFNKKKINRKLIQLDKSFNLIKEWDNLSEVSKAYNISESNISSCCNGKQKTGAGFIWRYKDDYATMSEDDKKYEPNISQYVPIVRLGENVKIYSSIKEALKDNNLTNGGHISSCCRGRRKSAYGYKWMYLNDYNKTF